MRTVMLLDPSSDWGTLFRNHLDASIRLLRVSAGAAQDTFLSSPRVDIVVVGWMEGHATIDFLDWLRARPFTGPILAATPEPSTNAMLLAAGCTTHVLNKHEAPAWVERLLFAGETR